MASPAHWTWAVLLLLGCVDKGADPRAQDTLSETGIPADTADTADAAPFALLSLNLHCLKLDGTTFPDTDARFDAIAALVAEEHVAVIAAQELCDDGEQNALELLETAIEQATAESWSSTATVAHLGWEGTDDEAEESVGLLVRGALSGAGSLTYAVQSGLNRVATYATLPEALGGLVVWSVHLEFSDAATRATQARETAGAALTLADPFAGALVAGDFNDVEGSEAHSSLRAAGFADLSDGLGTDRIDHVFLHRGAAFRATEARLAFDGEAEPVVSDHPGVLVHLEPAEGEAVALTRITATVDVGLGHFLALRGGTEPLSWDHGWPAQVQGSDTWRLVLSELPEGEDFVYKALVDDTTWQTGENTTGTGGADNAVAPSF